MNAQTNTIYVDETRYNLYATIHKGLRRAQTQLLARIGSVDASDPSAVAAVLADVRLMNTLGRKHLAHENLHIHQPIEARRGGATAGLVDDHEHHERDFDEIEAMLERIEAARPNEKAALLRGLYLRYSRFLVEDFAHMLEEETETLSLLHQLFDDEELAAIEGRIVGSVDPDLMMHFLRIMVPAMNPAERAGMIGGMKAGMPAPVFAAVMQAAIEPVLEPADLRSLKTALQIAA